MISFRNVFYLLLALSAVTFSQQHPIAEVHQLATAGLEQIILQNYPGAEKTFNTLEKKYPSIPLGKVFLAAGKIAREYELHIPFSDRTIVKWLDEASAQADKLLRANENDVWNNYYKGIAEGYRAYYFALQDNWLNAFTSGLTAKRYFDRCQELDPSFADSYVAIGAYKYWKSEKTEFLSWFVKDERQEGIKLLESAIKSRSYHSFLAVHNLVWIHIYRKEYKQAYDEILPAVKKYPSSRFFTWDYARIMEEIDKEKAIALYKGLITAYQKTWAGNRCNIITLNYIVAKNFNALGNRNSAAAHLSYIPNRSQLSKYEIEELGKRLERIESLKKDLGVQ